MVVPTKQVWFSIPGIGVALLPKLFCPLCWPLYAGIVSSVGLGFLIGTTYLLGDHECFPHPDACSYRFSSERTSGISSAYFRCCRFSGGPDRQVLFGIESDHVRRSWPSSGRIRVECVASPFGTSRVCKLRSRNDGSDEWNGDCASWKPKGKLKSSAPVAAVAKTPSNW